MADKEETTWQKQERPTTLRQKILLRDSAGCKVNPQPLPRIEITLVFPGGNIRPASLKKEDSSLKDRRLIQHLPRIEN